MDNLLIRYFKEIPQAAQCVAVDLQNVSDWYFENEQDEYDSSEWAALVPPYPYMWMEYTLPKSYIEEGKRHYFHRNFAWRSFGCWIRCHEIEEAKRATAWKDRYLESILAHRTGMDNDEVLSQLTQHIADKHSASPFAPRWVAIYNIYGYCPEAGQLVHVNSHSFYLDDRGKSLVHFNSITPGVFDFYKEWMGIDDIAPSDFMAFSVPFLFATSLMHCKNITESASPRNQSESFNKKREVKGLPVVRYKVLNIKPITQSAHTSRNAKGDATRNALHFVRGHFKDFTESGLFGKYKGVYWWSDNARGDPSNGIIDKDYRISKKILR